MKKIILLSILFVTIKCHAQDTTNHPVLDTSFHELSVAQIDTIQWNLTDTAGAGWLGCKTLNDNLSNKCTVEWYLLDVNKNLIAVRHFDLTGDDYKAWDATALWLIYYTRNKFLKTVTFKQ